MSFLAPIAGIIAGAVALPLLTLLYFLKLRRRPVRVSSVLLWQRAVEDLQVNAPFRWLRWSWLLAMQLLSAALLCAALARPVIEGQGPPSARLVLVIDASASMSAASAAPDGVADETRLEQARRAALARIDALARQSVDGRAPEAMVISLAGSARVARAFTSDRGALRQAVESIEATDQPGDLDAALALVEAQLAGGVEEGVTASPPRVVVFSDGAFEAARRRVRAGAGDATVEFVRAGPAPDSARDNVGIVAASATRDYDEPTTVRLFLRLLNAGGAEASAPLSLLLDGQRVGGRVVTVPGATDEGPGEASVTLNLEAPGGGLLEARVDRRDELSADNTVGLLLASSRPPRIFIVAPEAGTPAERFTTRQLERGLEVVSGRMPERISPSEYESLAGTAELVEKVDLLVFDGVRPRRLAPIASAHFGAPPSIPGLIVLDDAASESAPGSQRVVAWLRTHPLLRSVSLDALRIQRSARLSVATGDDAGEGGSARAQITPIAWGEDAPLMLSIEDAGAMRTVVAFPLAWSTWPTQTSFVVFLSNLVAQSTRVGEGAPARGFTTGEPLVIRPLDPLQAVTARGPVDLSASAAEGAASVSLGAPPLVGVYRVENAVQEDALAPVNLLDEAESAIATADRLVVRGDEATASGAGDAGPREIWHWFVLAATALLTIEWLLFAWRMRV